MPPSRMIPIASLCLLAACGDTSKSATGDTNNPTPDMRADMSMSHPDMTHDMNSAPVDMHGGADMNGVDMDMNGVDMDMDAPTGCTIFPPDNPWNQDISQLPVHPNSDNFIESIGRTRTMHPDFGTEWQGAPIGIPFVIVPANQPRVPVTFQYADESDPGPYPIPADAPIEGGPNGDGDRHVLALSLEECKLYELFNARPVDNGASWTAGSGAIFDLRSNALRPDGWTSADAAGLPIYPGLVRYDEVVEQKKITHALRFTARRSQRAFVHPATHWASSSTDANLPPMGLRLRMKSTYDCSGYTSEVQVICAALKQYGMFVADNGSDWYLSGAPDPRWSDDNLRDLKKVPGDAFEVVNTGPIITAL